MAVKQVGCVLLVALMFIPLGLSMECWNTPDVREWHIDAVCTEISARTSNICKWDLNYYGEYERVDGSVSFKEIPKSATNSLVSWNCSLRYRMPVSKREIYYFHVFFGKSPSTARIAFNLTVVDPGELTLNNCPQSVKDGDNVTCECTTQRTGRPPPILSWRGQTTSVLHFTDVRLDKVQTTYTCEMIWGNRSKTVSYSFGGKLEKEHTKSDHEETSSVKVIAVVGAVVSVIAIIIAVIAIVAIRKKGKRNGRKTADKQETASRSGASKTRDSEVKLIDNRCYVNVEFEGEGGGITKGNQETEATEPAMHDKVTTQSDLYAVIGEDIERQTIEPDLYTAVDKNNDKQTTQPADVYAVVEKNKCGQPVPRDLYATVEKPKGKQQTKKDESASSWSENSDKEREITIGGDVNAAVDKGDKSVSPSGFAPVEEMYAQVTRPPK